MAYWITMFISPYNEFFIFCFFFIRPETAFLYRFWRNHFFPQYPTNYSIRNVIIPTIYRMAQIVLLNYLIEGRQTVI